MRWDELMCKMLILEIRSATDWLLVVGGKTWLDSIDINLFAKLWMRTRHHKRERERDPNNIPTSFDLSPKPVRLLTGFICREKKERKEKRYSIDSIDSCFITKTADRKYKCGVKKQNGMLLLASTLSHLDCNE